MVLVTVKAYGDWRALEMDGHAGYAPGNDVVCAGCSAIAYTLMGWMVNAPEHVSDMEQTEVASGRLRLSARGDSTFAAVFDAAMIGLLQMEKQYPDNVRVKQKNFFANL